MSKTVKVSVAAAAALGLTAAAADAASPMIEQAKAQCVVGEQADGYLGLVDPMTASEDVKREVRAVNQQRKAAFAKLAADNGVTIEDAGRLTGKQLVEGAESGECVQLPDGSWARQP